MLEPVVGREAQYYQLVSIIQKSEFTLPSAVLVWGPSSSGKSTVVEKAIEDTKIQYVAIVNAREIVCGLRPFLATIIQQLFEKTGSVDSENLNCDSTAEFVNELCQLRIKANVGSKRFIVVIEEMETLRADHGDLIEVLSRLQDMVQFNICVMFLSSLPFSSFSGLLDLKPMVTVNFPQYTKDEMNAILLKEAPPGANAELYAFHIKMTLSIFYMACRDLRKLQRLAILNFEKFSSAVVGQNSRISAKKMHELWTLVQPQLTKDFRTLKANIIPAHDAEGCRGKQQGTKNKNIYQLPKFVKYLLLAAYLATHNPATSDRRFFVKSQLGKKRRKIENQYAEKIHEAQNFSLPRLVAIYSFLSDYQATKDQLMMNQLTNLCEMQLLERVDNSNVPLEEPKFKCLASFEFIDDIARSVDVEIKKYLYHFV